MDNLEVFRVCLEITVLRICLLFIYSCVINERLFEINYLVLPNIFYGMAMNNAFLCLGI